MKTFSVTSSAKFPSPSPSATYPISPSAPPCRRATLVFGTLMSTAKQTDANRRNATKSTGPSSAEGKAASSQNALKTGIDAESLVIRGESRPTLEALTTRYLDRFQPSTPEQSVLVDALISADWLLRRLRKVEPDVWER